MEVLIIDDDKRFTDSLKKVLSNVYNVTVANNPIDALRIFSLYAFDVVLLDICFNPMTNDRQGIQVLREIRQADDLIPVIMMTAYSDIDIAVEAMKLGSVDYIQKKKTIKIEEYKEKIDALFREGKLRRQISLLQQEIERLAPSDIIGETPKMKEIRDAIKQIAQDEKITVLIRGETGTGKDLVAKAIHQAGERKDKPFVAVSLPALDKDTIYSELFGQEEGAYSDTSPRRIGLIEKAHSGILFLDEIGDLDPDIQAKLLRVIENHEFMRMGSNNPIKVDFQLITATHQNLEDLVKDKKFREDLYYRLKGYVIELPPLRERKEDIPLLVDYFLQLLKRQGRCSAKTTISEEAMQSFINYDWPGNVRELKNAIESAVLNAKLRELKKVDPKEPE